MLVINLARHLGLSVYRVTQLLSDMTFEDGVTGVYGTRYLRRFLEEQVANDEPFVLTLFDLDHFAVINEARGPLEGDFLLKSFASRLKTVLKGNDVVARYREDAFAVVTFGRPLEAVFDAVDRIRHRVAEKPVKTRRGGDQVALSVSAGMASFPEDAATIEGIFEAAETSLFAAKKLGGNLVQVASQADAAAKSEGAALSGLPCGTFVGRSDELAEAELFVEEVRDRKPGILLVGGDRGIGKTRLLKELVGKMRGRGVVYLASTGRGSRNRMSRALVYLVQRYYERHPATRDWLRRALNPLQRKGLAEVVPLFAAWRGQRTPQDPDLRRPAIEALEGALVGMAREAPLLLLLDNISEIDPMALQAVRPILRENKAPLGLIATMSGELGLDGTQDALVDFLAELRKMRRLKSIYLPLITTLDMNVMIGEILPGFSRPSWFDDVLRRGCAGNPQRIEEAVRWLVEKGRLARAGRSWRLQVEGPDELRAELAAAAGREPRPEPAQLITNVTVMGTGLEGLVYPRVDWKAGTTKPVPQVPKVAVPPPPAARPAPAPVAPAAPAETGTPVPSGVEELTLSQIEALAPGKVEAPSEAAAPVFSQLTAPSEASVPSQVEAPAPSSVEGPVQNVVEGPAEPAVEPAAADPLAESFEETAAPVEASAPSAVEPLAPPEPAVEAPVPELPAPLPEPVVEAPAPEPAVEPAVADPLAESFEKTAAPVEAQALVPSEVKGPAPSGVEEPAAEVEAPAPELPAPPPEPVVEAPAPELPEPAVEPAAADPLAESFEETAAPIEAPAPSAVEPLEPLAPPLEPAVEAPAPELPAPPPEPVVEAPAPEPPEPAVEPAAADPLAESFEETAAPVEAQALAPSAVSEPPAPLPEPVVEGPVPSKVEAPVPSEVEGPPEPPAPAPEPVVEAAAPPAEVESSPAEAIRIPPLAPIPPLPPVPPLQPIPPLPPVPPLRVLVEDIPSSIELVSDVVARPSGAPPRRPPTAEAPVEERKAPAPADIDLRSDLFQDVRRFAETLCAAVRRGRLYPQWVKRDGLPMPALREGMLALVERLPMAAFAIESNALRMNGRPVPPGQGVEFVDRFVKLLDERLIGRLTVVAGVEPRECDAFVAELCRPADPAGMKENHWAVFREREKITHLDVLQRPRSPDAKPAGPALADTVRGEQAPTPDQLNQGIQAMRALGVAAQLLGATAPEDADLENVLRGTNRCFQEILARIPVISFESKEGALSMNGQPLPAHVHAKFVATALEQKKWQTLTMRRGILDDEIRALASALAVPADDPQAAVYLRSILSPDLVRNFALARPPAPTVESVVGSLLKSPADAFLAVQARIDFAQLIQAAAAKENLAEALIARLAAVMGDEKVEVRRKALEIGRDSLRKLRGRALSVFLVTTHAALTERIRHETDAASQTTLAALARLWLAAAIFTGQVTLAAQLCRQAIKPVLASGRLAPQSQEAFVSGMQSVGQGAGAALITMLSSGSEAERDGALTLLGVVGGPLAAQLVRIVFESNDAETRKAAARAISAIGGAVFQELVFAVTPQADADRVLRLLEVLDLAGVPRLVEPMQAALSHPDGAVREAAYALLERAPAPAAEDALRFLIRGLDAGAVIRSLEIGAARKLAGLGTEIVRLAQATDSEEIARACCVYFQAVPTPAAVPALQKIFDMRGRMMGLVKGWSDRTRAAAVSAALLVATPAARSLVQAALKDSSAAIREAARPEAKGGSKK